MRKYIGLFCLEICLATSGMPSCPCSTTYTPETDPYKNEGGLLAYVNELTQVVHVMRNGYGLHACEAHDRDIPECSDPNDQPAWCADTWCYIADTCVTNGTTVSEEVEQEGGKNGLPCPWFPNSQLRRSYATCGANSTFAQYQATSKLTANDLVALPEQHVRDMVQKVEAAASSILGFNDTCNIVDSCACESCTSLAGSQWGNLTVDLRETCITFNPDERGRFENEARCFGRQLHGSFKSIAQNLHSDPNRLAYMYFGLQDNGAIIQWPASQWCPAEYDARFRPWYAAAASGPKDVVLTLDNSGSMLNNDRWRLLKEGVALLLGTLTEYDYIGIILFSVTARRFKPQLRRATIALKQEIVQWLEDPRQTPGNSTRFDIAIEESFSLIKGSRVVGASTGCQSAVLLLSDGSDASHFLMSTFDDLQKGMDPPAIFFTFTFGDDSDREIPEKIACRSAGVYWDVADGENIGVVMSEYYKYFVSGVTITSPRWLTYADVRTGETLVAACLPSYRSGALLGAGCMDVNVMVRLAALEQKVDYADFLDKVRATSSKCASFSLPQERLEQMRLAARTDCSSVDLGLVVIIGGAVAFCSASVWGCRYILKRRSDAVLNIEMCNGEQPQLFGPEPILCGIPEPAEYARGKPIPVAEPVLDD